MAHASHAPACRRLGKNRKCLKLSRLRDANIFQSPVTALRYKERTPCGAGESARATKSYCTVTMVLLADVTPPAVIVTGTSPAATFGTTTLIWYTPAAIRPA